MKCERDLLRVDEIRVPEGRRNTDPVSVKNLAESMARIGLQCPITVRLTEDDAGAYVDLVAGAHRLEAAKLLGWTDIESMVMPASATDIDARLWEISENLHRAELGPEERTFQEGEYVRLTQRKLADSGLSSHGGKKIASDGTARGRPESGVSEAARALGMSNSKADRAAKAYDLPEDVKAAAVEHGIGVRGLDQVARAPDPAAKLQEIVAERKRPAESDPTPATEDEVFRGMSADLRKWKAKTDRDTWASVWDRIKQYEENML